ncbi:MAG TPA: hypothetical protein DDZ96_10120 [Porphyromonadaceae bacterium]|nr:hypothetical protein [Porphyromonadaceae bacterium]HBX20452.1 hypothetical protein [Porphyromonadaceae bacterium]HCM19876.1 hypothetical protein [Porphyromonadaceae bacterium]
MSYQYEAFKKFRAACRINTKLSKKAGQHVVQIRSSQKIPGNASYRYEALKKSRATRRTNTKPSKKAGQRVVLIRRFKKSPSEGIRLRQVNTAAFPPLVFGRNFIP